MKMLEQTTNEVFRVMIEMLVCCRCSPDTVGTFSWLEVICGDYYVIG